MNEIEKMMQNANIEKHWNSTPYGGVEEYYPPFTAEKELKLIKWFMHSGHFCPIRFYVPWLVDDIASYINFLWQSLTEEEKQQVKGILE